MIGKVFLVGAGPGDPELITRRGSRLLLSADVVVVDALVNPKLFHSLKAQIINVGKRGPGAASGSHLEMPQTSINQLLIRLGQKGKKVVRLKGGDPFVFGRGSEEVDALHRAGVPFEVVPGVSSVTGVPTYAGIPLTDRRFASQVTFITGQSKDDNKVRAPRVDWKSLSPNQTLVVLMGVSRWPIICKRLIQEGWPRSKPVAAIEWGTTPQERVLGSILSESPNYFKRQKLTAPAIIIIGDVVRLRKNISNNKPLSGKRIVVTRPLDQSASIIELLEKEGAKTLLSPSIKIEPLQSAFRLENHKVKYDWIIFMSVNAVKTFGEVVRGVSVLVVGPETKRVAEALGWKVNKMPEKFNSAGVLAALRSVRGKRIVIPRVQNAPKDLPVELRRRGALVDEIVTYQTKPVGLSPAMKKELLSGVDGISFTSASTVEGFLASITKSERRRIFSRSAVFSIGPQTSATLRRNGIRKIQEAHNSTSKDLVAAMRLFYSPCL